MWDNLIGENGNESKFGPDLVVRDLPPSIDDVLDDLNRNWRFVKIVSPRFSLRLETKNPNGTRHGSGEWTNKLAFVIIKCTLTQKSQVCTCIG